MSGLEFDSPLDAGIARAVIVANGAGFTTYESCEGGVGHAYPEPTVRGFGTYQEVMRAVMAMIDLALPVCELRQVWHLRDSVLYGPCWDIVLVRKLETTDD